MNIRMFNEQPRQTLAELSTSSLCHNRGAAVTIGDGCDSTYRVRLPLKQEEFTTANIEGSQRNHDAKDVKLSPLFIYLFYSKYIHSYQAMHCYDC